jgi:hypothetical protein
MISDEGHHHHRTALADLGVRLAELDDRITDEDEASRTLLNEDGGSSTPWPGSSTRHRSLL